MLRVPPDAHAANWIVRGVRDFDHTVGSLVPAGFESYARVFHPASRRVGDDMLEVRWGEVARANGRVMHPAAEWGSLIGSRRAEGQAGLWDQPPCVGDLPEDVAPRLADALVKHTREPDSCYFGVSQGGEVLGFAVAVHEDCPDPERVRQAALEVMEAEIESWRTIVAGAPRFTVRQGPMHLLEGPVAAIREFYADWRDPPSLWWPADRAWCAATNIDLMTTYVGGSSGAVEALLADKELEVLAVPHTQSVTWEADTVNPLPWQPE